MSANEKLDKILTQLGNGPWNICMALCSAWMYLLIPSQALSGAFVAPKINFECANNSSDKYNDSKCHYWNESLSTNETCTAWTFDNSTFSSTITSEFNLVCSHDYQQVFYQTLFLFGQMFSAPINGILSDTYGRKTLFGTACGIFTFVAIVIYFLPYYWLILSFRFITGLMIPPLIHSGYILAVESSEPTRRSYVGICIYIPYAFGLVLWGGIAYAIRDWRWLQLAVSLPLLACIPLLLLMDESPRWLIVTGRHQQALQVLKRAAKWNKAELSSDQELILTMKQIEQEATFSQNKAEENENSTARDKLKLIILYITVLFRTSRLRLHILVVTVEYFTASMVYYGLSMNATNYNANPFIYMALSGLVELPAYTLVAPLIAKAGRKNPIIIFYLFCGLAIIALGFIPKDISWLIISLAMIGKLCISCAYQILFLFGSELIPTEVRVQGMGTSMFISRIGSLLCPVITDYLGPIYPWFPSLAFGGVSIFAGLVTLLVPETLGRPLPDTIHGLETRKY